MVIALNEYSRFKKAIGFVLLTLICNFSFAQSPGHTRKQVMFSEEVDGMEIVFITHFDLERGATFFEGIGLVLKMEALNAGVLRNYLNLDGKKYYLTSFDGSVSKQASTEYRELWLNIKLKYANVTVQFGGIKETNLSKSIEPGKKVDFFVTRVVKDISQISLDNVQITSVNLEGTTALKDKIRSLERYIKENEASKLAAEKAKREQEEAEKLASEKAKKDQEEADAKAKANEQEKQQQSSNANSQQNVDSNPNNSYQSQSSETRNSSSSGYSTQDNEDRQAQINQNNAYQAQNLNQQAQQLAMQGDIDGAQVLANQANSLDRSVSNASSTSQFIQQQRSIRDSRLTAEAWSRGIDMSANTLINLFKPVDLDLIRTAETPDQALQGYEQIRDQIEERRQIADQNFKTFHQQNLQDIQNSKSVNEAKANAIVGFANIAGNMAAQAKANADAKKANQEKKEKFDQFRSELMAMHQKNKATYLQNAANEPREELEEYYLEMYKFHQCGLNSIEEKFNYESSEWSKTANHCDKPYKSYGSDKIDYKEVVRRKKRLANRFSDKSEMFMNAAKYFANKRVLEDKNDPEGYLIRAELSDDIIGRLGDILIAYELDPSRNDIQRIRKATLNQFAAEFFSAIDEQNINFISRCIDNKFHKLVVSTDNETPVVYAVKKNKELVLNHFINRSTELQSPNTLSNILYLSVAKDADKCVELLMKRKVNDQLEDQPPAFQLAVEYGHEKSALAFLRNNKNPIFTLRHFEETEDIENGSKTLRYIVIAGIQSDNDLLIEIAKSKKPEIEKGKYDNRDTYLSYCARNNSLKAFNALIKDNPFAQNSVDLYGESLVQVAVKSGSFRLVKRLYQLGADFSILNNNVDLIFSEKSISMLETYQEVGINVNIQNTEGNTIFHLEALGQGIVQGLFSSSLKPNLSLKNQAGYQVFHIAAWKSDDLLIQKLINSGADINAQGPYQWTALHFAARENDQSLANQLINNGADKLAKDQWGRTPKQVAKERGFAEIKAILK
jgi:ankyrin repeat protein